MTALVRVSRSVTLLGGGASYRRALSIVIQADLPSRLPMSLVESEGCLVTKRLVNETLTAESKSAATPACVEAGSPLGARPREPCAHDAAGSVSTSQQVRDTMHMVSGPPPLRGRRLPLALLRDVASLVRRRPELTDATAPVVVTPAAPPPPSPAVSELDSLHSGDSYFWDSSVHISLSVSAATGLHESALQRRPGGADGSLFAQSARKFDARRGITEVGSDTASSDTDCRSVASLKEPGADDAGGNHDVADVGSKYTKGNDDVSTELGRETSSKPKRSRKRKLPSKCSEAIRPNYFVAIQITDCEILSAVQSVQERIVVGNALLKAAIVPLPTMHLTLMVMHLADDEQVENAKRALDECSEMLLDKLSCKEALNLTVEGLSNFGNNVVFAKVEDGASIAILTTISDSLGRKPFVADAVSAAFAGENIVSTDRRGFQPHLTILKLSRAHWLKKKGVRKVDPDLYQSYAALRFGVQRVTTLQLCAMDKPKTVDGYYHTAYCVSVRNYSTDCGKTFRQARNEEIFTVKFDKPEITWDFHPCSK